jgi:hypothetical protein
MTGFFEATQLLKFFSLKMDFRFQPVEAGDLGTLLFSRSTRIGLQVSVVTKFAGLLVKFRDGHQMADWAK